MNTPAKHNEPGWFDRFKARCLAWWAYCSEGVWTDHRDTLKVKTVKTINLTVSTFMSSDLQNKAAALTYQTLLAIVPALALLFAIGRGFGFQNLLQKQLYTYFPSQQRALEMAFSFVDSCLAQASEGLFVGVGIIFLLWTIISLLSNVEDTFNQVWGVKDARSMFRKVTDYLAICIILPILMICSGGLQIFMSSAIQKLLPFDVVTPFVEFALDCVSFMLAWLFFAGAYLLIPNTKVRFSNAMIAGTIAGTAFQVLQWLFVSGQMGVAKYNAIYGSFSFLPLMLLWMQFSWLITLAGALICSSAQNISMFSFIRHTSDISPDYRRKIMIAILAIILKRFRDEEEPLSPKEIADSYGIPFRLVRNITDTLLACDLVVRIAPQGEQTDVREELPLQPSTSIDKYTLAWVLSRIDAHGESGFVPGFDTKFKSAISAIDNLTARLEQASAETLIINL